MQLSAVPDTGMMNVLLRSSVNYNFKQKLIGLLYFQFKSTFNFCRVMPILLPSGNDTFTPKSATSSKNWNFKLQFSYPSFNILNEDTVYISNGTTGIMTYRLLKNRFGRDDVPLKITSTYFRGYVNVLFFMNKGIL